MEFYAILLFLFLFIFIISKLRTRSNKNLPPGPASFPLIGHLHLLMSNPKSLPHHILRDLATKYGPVMHLQLGEISTVVISSLDAAKQVLKTYDLTLASRPSLIAADALFYGQTDIAFAPYGAHWRQMRKISMLELLSTKRVQAIQHIRQEESLNFCRWIASNEGNPIDLAEKIVSTTYDIISRSSFGRKTKEQEAFIAVLIEALDVLGGFHIADMYPSAKWLQTITGMRQTLERLRKGADRLLETIIQQRIKSDGKKDKGDEEEDLLDVLLKLQYSGDLELPLTMDHIKAVMLIVFFAGSETSSTVTDWTMLELLKNPKVLKKVQDEVRGVFDAKGGYVRESHIDELKYLKLVIKETLRMHPPLPLLLPREAMENCEILGYHVPAKTRVVVNAWALGRDPKYWENPDSFIPERFLDSNVDFKGNDFQYIPFGAGRRICPGISYGLANMEIQLASFLYYFDWSLPEGMKPQEIDFTEAFAITVRRKQNLNMVPRLMRPLPTP